jgi:thiol:disulfide interchange protein DsbA
VESGKKIEVIEFFSYGCPHCADLEPVMQPWIKALPADVQFRRVPVLFQERWIGLAKVYYTLDALGEDARLSPEVFVAIHQNGLNLSNEKTFFDWAASKGLDPKKVADMYASFAIAGKINRAKQQAQIYNIQSVPTVIVDGKFVTASDKVGSHAAMPAAINALVAKARAERPKS